MTSNNDLNAVWTCTVSLLKTHDYAGPHESMDEDEDVWMLRDQPETIHLCTVTDKDELEHLIQLAQDAVLTPGADPETFFSKKKNSRTQALSMTREKFSPNTVYLEISDHDIPNLSFCDLPGIINQTDSLEDEYLVEVVRDLVKDKIEGDTTLILLACSMGSDIQTSSAASIIRKARAEDRCVGVLTKPDLLQTGDNINIWHDTLDGKKFGLGHGYFVTKQPSPAELDLKIDHDEARKREVDFFDNTEPWTTELVKFKAQFGTDNLRIALAEKLARIIHDSLPDIMEKVNERLGDINQALEQFPPKPTENAYGIISDVLNQFANTVHEHVESVYTNPKSYTNWEDGAENSGIDFRTEFRKLTEELRDDVVKVRPDIEWEDGDSSTTTVPIRGSAPPTPSRKGEHEVVDLSEDVPTRSSSKPVPATPSKKRKMENSNRSVSNTPSQSRNSAKKPRTTVSRITAPRFKLATIKQKLIRASSSGLGEYDPRALDQLILASLRNWETLINQFVKQIEQLMHELFKTVLKGSFGAYKGTPLPANVGTLAREFVTIAIMSFKVCMDQILEKEQFHPFTMNRQILSSNTKSQQTYLEDRRFKERANALIDSKEEITSRETEGQERLKKLNKERDNLIKELGEDEFQPSIKAMATVRAYYFVAPPRFLDNICQSAHADLFGKCKKRLLDQLRTGLGLEQPDSKSP